MHRFAIDHPAQRRISAARAIFFDAAHVRLAQQAQRLVHHRPTHQTTRLAPVIALTMLEEVDDRLLDDIFGRRAMADDRSGNCQQPARMRRHRLLE